jgi:hypothetical protein
MDRMPNEKSTQGYGTERGAKPFILLGKPGSQQINNNRNCAQQHQENRTLAFPVPVNGWLLHFFITHKHSFLSLNKFAAINAQGKLNHEIRVFHFNALTPLPRRSMAKAGRPLLAANVSPIRPICPITFSKIFCGLCVFA